MDFNGDGMIEYDDFLATILGNDLKITNSFSTQFSTRVNNQAEGPKQH